ncbi:MAG: lysoplasmalogenase, partial [Rubrivivax sp.]|nr:lysoplasmalogenase [Rubrivivax sp.]
MSKPAFDRPGWLGATALSALLAIASAPWALAAPWLNFVFKPLTTILILAMAWPRGRATPGLRRGVLGGLVLSLLGDVALLWPQQGFLPGLIGFLLAHLAYLWAMTRVQPLAARRLPFTAYALASALILALLWPGVPAGLRLPVLIYVLALATMAAQAAVLWRAAPADAAARRLALGGALFVVSDALLATNRFVLPLPLASLWVLATYWTAQACIA